MRTTVISTAAIAALALGSCIVAPGANADATASRYGHVGRWITDDQGRVVLPMGINLSNKIAPYRATDLGFGADDAAFLRRQGFTSVRLGVIWKAVEPTPGNYDQSYLANIRETVNLLNSYGISTLVDMHQDMINEQFQGEGFPDWAVQMGGWPNIIKAGFPSNQFFNVALQTAYDNFHANKSGPGGVGLADRYAAMWAAVAQSLKSTPGVLGFDLYNEPWPGTSYSACLLSLCNGPDAKIGDVQQRAVDAMRAVDPKTAIYYEPNSLFNTGISTSVKVTGTNVGFSFHDYCAIGTAFNSYSGCEGPDGNVFSNAKAQETKYGQMSLLTEFGATTEQTTLRSQADLALKNQIGWYYWSYTGKNDVTTSGAGDKEALVFDPAKPPIGDNIDTAKLESLAIMHPSVVAGTPGAAAYDRSTGTFTMSYTPVKVFGGTFAPGSVSTVEIPAVAAPSGYSVSVTGARVTSAPDAGTLQLALLPGATAVQLKVTRN